MFVALYKDGLVYRDKRLVNWDPKLLTAISDLEVEMNEVDGHLWHFDYPIEGEEGRVITVATTRPETMLGDTGVAVHPDDDRYKDLIGKYAVLPLVGRRIPIVADEHADPEQGSGAVKITPAHDFNDFEVGRRHDLALINIFDDHAHLNDEVPEAYRGLERFEARKKVVADMAAEGRLRKIDDHRHTVPYGDRSGVVIEPRLTDQWYVNAEVLAKPAIEAVERGETVFVPKNWEKTYYEWMRNIQPWCVSRQLWWGHRIPAWYGPDGRIFVEESEREAQAAAVAHYGEQVELVRDEDVLDTWFSSALWPFSTLGWPEETPELKRFYPTDVLVTGFDIIFFWVARMMMMALHFMKDGEGKPQVPFHTVYIHALVRDEHGQKMSKSKGNVIDPLTLIDEFGADALRFTLAAMAAQGRDIRLSKDRVAGYRNFGTKLWNAARFCLMNECYVKPDFDPADAKSSVNKWIISETVRAAEAVTKGIEAHRYNEAAGALYQFVWHKFCDWYLEISKPVLTGADAAAKAETRAAAAWTLDQILTLMHPFSPFITEELWSALAAEAGVARESMLIQSPWPELSEALVDEEACADLDWLIRLVTEIRSVRAEMNVPPGAKIPMRIMGASADTESRLSRFGETAAWLARLSDYSVGDAAPTGAVQFVHDEATVCLEIADAIDIGAEIARLEKGIGKADAELKKLDAKLGNEKFTSRAPAEVVEEQRRRRAEEAAARDKLADALARLRAI
ncbi:MAG: valine--tRNA ligase [Parvularculaceae bacterium]